MFAAPLWLSQLAGRTTGVLARHKQGFFNLFIGTSCIVLSVRSISKEHKIAKLERRVAQQKEEAAYLKHLLCDDSSEWSRRLGGDSLSVIYYIRSGFYLAEARIYDDGRAVKSIGFDYDRGQTIEEKELVPSRPAGSALGLWYLSSDEAEPADGVDSEGRDGAQGGGADHATQHARQAAAAEQTQATKSTARKAAPEGGLL